MTIIDTRGTHRYSPLIPATRALCLASSGQRIEIILDDPDAFNDFKEYLSEQGIGFREIYDGEIMRIQFTAP